MCESAENRTMLSLSECLSLLYVDTAPARGDLPGRHATKFLELGLVRMDGDRVGYTASGRQVAANVVTMSRAEARHVH